MEYLCIAIDVGSNMGPRMSKNLRDTDKASSHLDLALYTLLSMFNRKVSRRCAAMPAATTPVCESALTVGRALQLIENPKHHVGIVTFGVEGMSLLPAACAPRASAAADRSRWRRPRAYRDRQRPVRRR